jgi:hypothetical protein
VRATIGCSIRKSSISSSARQEHRSLRTVIRYLESIEMFSEQEFIFRHVSSANIANVRRRQSQCTAKVRDGAGMNIAHALSFYPLHLAEELDNFAALVPTDKRCSGYKMYR